MDKFFYAPKRQIRIVIEVEEATTEDDRLIKIVPMDGVTILDVEEFDLAMAQWVSRKVATSRIETPSGVLEVPHG